MSHANTVCHMASHGNDIPHQLFIPRRIQMQSLGSQDSQLTHTQTHALKRNTHLYIGILKCLSERFNLYNYRQ